MQGSLIRLALGCCLLVRASAMARDASGDLQAAFAAVFHKSSPLSASIEGRLLPSGKAEMLETQLVPVRLARLSGRRQALIVTEDILQHGWYQQGAITIAYLARDRTGWTVERTWHRLAFTGSFGHAAKTIRIARSWSQPLAMTSSELCGMNSCNTDVAIFALGRKAPRFLGTVDGPGSHDSEWEGSTCESYGFTARFARAASPRNLLSVRYSGWTAPPGTGRPRHRFRRRADIAISGHRLVLRPDIAVPECGR